MSTVRSSPRPFAATRGSRPPSRSRPPGMPFPPGAAAKGGQNAAPRHRQYADEAYAHLYDELAQWRAEGVSLAAIAAELSARGEPLRYMGNFSAWSPTQVARVLKRGSACGPKGPSHKLKNVKECYGLAAARRLFVASLPYPPAVTQVGKCWYTPPRKHVAFRGTFPRYTSWQMMAFDSIRAAGARPVCPARVATD